MKYLLIFTILMLPGFAHNYHGCALAPDNLTGWVVCLDTVLILHTTDGGATWETQNPPDSATKRFFDVTCIDQLQAWTVGILGEILHTDNGGINWYNQAIGLSKYGTRIEMLDQDYGWATCGDGTIGQTTNGGNYWDQIFTPWYRAEYYGVSFVDQWDGWVVAGYPDSMATGQGMIIHSSDGGLTWDSLYQVTDYEDFFDVHFFNLLDGIVVGGNESDYSPIILKTTDGGYTWNSISSPANTYYLRSVDFVGEKGWAVGRFGTIIHTTDNGNTWAFQTNPSTSTLFDVDFSDTLHGIACGQNIILYTTDGGQNWHSTAITEQQPQNSNPRFLEIFPNPFSEKTIIQVKASNSENHTTNLKIFDHTGRLLQVKNLAGNKTIWDGTDQSGQKLPQGIYFIQIQTAKEKEIKKVIFLH